MLHFAISSKIVDLYYYYYFINFFVFVSVLCVIAAQKIFIKHLLSSYVVLLHSYLLILLCVECLQFGQNDEHQSNLLMPRLGKMQSRGRG